MVIAEEITYGHPPVTAANLSSTDPSGAIIYEWHSSPSECAALDQFFAHVSAHRSSTTSSSTSPISLPTPASLFSAVIATAPQVRAEGSHIHVRAVVRRVLLKLLHVALDDNVDEPDCAFTVDDCEELVQRVAENCRAVVLTVQEQEMLVSALGRKCHEVFSGAMEPLWEQEKVLVREKEEILTISRQQQQQQQQQQRDSSGTADRRAGRK